MNSCILDTVKCLFDCFVCCTVVSFYYYGDSLDEEMFFYAIDDIFMSMESIFLI